MNTTNSEHHNRIGATRSTTIAADGPMRTTMTKRANSNWNRTIDMPHRLRHYFQEPLQDWRKAATAGAAAAAHSARR